MDEEGGKPDGVCGDGGEPADLLAGEHRLGGVAVKGGHLAGKHGLVRSNGKEGSESSVVISFMFFLPNT